MTKIGSENLDENNPLRVLLNGDKKVERDNHMDCDNGDNGDK